MTSEIKERLLSSKTPEKEFIRFNPIAKDNLPMFLQLGEISNRERGSIANSKSTFSFIPKTNREVLSYSERVSTPKKKGEFVFVVISPKKATPYLDWEREDVEIITLFISGVKIKVYAYTSRAVILLPLSANEDVIKRINSFVELNSTLSEGEISETIALVSSIIGVGRNSPGGSPGEKDFFAQARDVRPSDLISGDLFYNEYGMTISPKADGERRLFVFYNGKGYLFYPKEGELSLKFISLEGNEISRETSRESEKALSIFDGEYLPSSQTFLVFDCLFRRGVDVRREGYLQRIEDIPTIISSSFAFLKKEIITIFTSLDFINADFKERAAQNFFDVFNSLDSKKKEYPTDGYTFTPIAIAYDKLLKVNTSSSFVQLPCILKWKPPNKLTIDFKLSLEKNQSGGQGTLLSNDRSKLVEFKDRSFNPQKNVDWRSILSSGAKDGDIIELSPRWKFGKVSLFFYRIRSDRTEPNNLFISRNIWELINSPVEKDVISGKTFYLVKKYHNEIKRQLFASKPEETVKGVFSKNANRGGYLLDIGSGRGGDIKKWGKYSKVYCIEPDSKNAAEFERRLSPRDTDKIKLRKWGCCFNFSEVMREAVSFFDNFDTQYPLTISMMLSLSFFWKDEETLSWLARFIRTLSTIYNSRTNKDVTFLFLTILGEEVSLTLPIGEEVRIGEALLLNTGDSLLVDISKSIVNRQTEWLVNLPELREKIHFRQIQFHHANKNPFMSFDEQKYSDMYGYGKWVSTPETYYPVPGRDTTITIDGVNFSLVGVGTGEENLSEVFAYFGFDIPQTLKIEEIPPFIKKNVIVTTLTGEATFYDASSSDPPILVCVDDGVYFPLIEN